MDRIHQSPARREEAPAEPAFSIDSALFSAPTSDTAHALFAPLHYEPGYSYPLVVWLHGAGDSENQLLRVMPAVSLRNYVAVAPRGTVPGGEGLAEGGFGWSQQPDHVEAAEQRIFDGIDAARRKWNISSRRIFLAGFDAGGTMAFRVAMNQPQHFAGILSLGGAFPTGRNPMGQLTQARRLPVFLAVGRDSATYDATQVCDDLRLLHSAGMSVTLRQYPCGHELSPQMLRDMDRWIIDQISQPSESSQSYGGRHSRL